MVPFYGFHQHMVAVVVIDILFKKVVFSVYLNHMIVLFFFLFLHKHIYNKRNTKIIIN